MSYNLFLDDERMPKKATVNFKTLEAVSGIGNTQWEIVRNFEAFVAIVEGKGAPAVVSFDHDLGEEHINELVVNGNAADYSKFRNTGYSCAEFLCNFCRERSIPFPRWFVHSFNPVGAENIRQLIHNYPHFEP